MSAWEELSFELEHITITGKRWGKGASKRVLALHGWLDNCASFDFVAPHLEADVVALDLAGHGRSGWRKTSGPYNIWEDIIEIAQVLAQLQWHDFILCGHSRGAVIGSILAGTLPERVTHAFYIDGLLPPPSKNSESVPEQLAASVLGQLDPARKRPTRFSEYDLAVAGRMRGFIPVSRDAAQALAARGVIEQGGAFIWGSDPKLHLPSALRLSQEQSLAFLDNATARAVFILAEDGVYKARPEIHQVIEKVTTLETKKLPGNHHLHMHGQHLVIAQLINSVLT